MQVLVVAALVLGGGPALAAPSSSSKIAERATPAVVMIRTPRGLGSGFVIGKDGTIVTNLHVIAGAQEATVVLADGQELSEVEVLAVDEAQDLALIRVPARPKARLKLGRSSKVKPGDPIVAIGHPLGLGNTVSDGLVSAIREVSDELTVLQITAPISPGSSGGPLLDTRGRAVGVATLVVTTGQNLNFAIPIQAVEPLLESAAGVPLADFHASRALVREVPHHSLSLLDGCPAPAQDALLQEIERAIAIGAPLYNEGNFEACYRVYAAVALQSEAKGAADGAADGAEDREPICSGARDALVAGLTRAERIEDWSGKAWAMRDAFDGLIDVIVRAKQRAARDVPRHPDGFLEACAERDVAQVRDAILAAIQSGAPLYDAGNPEACYRIYEGAVRDIERRWSACEPAISALQHGLGVAGERAGWPGKAWALRDAFDGVLDAIERAEGP